MAGIPCRTPWPWAAVPRRFPGSSVRRGYLRNAFPAPPKRFLTTVPFFNWHKVLLGILALSECKALGPKPRWSCRVGRRREVFVYSSHRRWALFISRAPLRCLTAGMAFPPQTFRRVSGRGTHGKVHQEIKAVKVVFPHTTAAGLRVVVYSLAVIPGHGISFSEGPFAP